MKLISSFVGILELVSEFSRLLAFGFRLFGNIFAGEIVLATMAFLIAYLASRSFLYSRVVRGLCAGVGLHDVGAGVLHDGDDEPRARALGSRDSAMVLLDYRWTTAGLRLGY